MNEVAWLKHTIKSLNMSQAEFAKSIGYSGSAVTLWLQGKRTVPENVKLQLGLTKKILVNCPVCNGTGKVEETVLGKDRT